MPVELLAEDDSVELLEVGTPALLEQGNTALGGVCRRWPV